MNDVDPRLSDEFEALAPRSHVGAPDWEGVLSRAGVGFAPRGAATRLDEGAHGRRRGPRRAYGRIAVAGLATSAAAVVLAIGVIDSREASDRQDDRNRAAASCAASIVYRQQLYLGNRIGWSPQPTSESGEARAPACGSGEDATVTVSAVEGISPDVALAVQGVEGVLYIASGRCAGMQGDAAIRDCLETTLEVGEVAYSRFSSDAISAAATEAGAGTLKTRTHKEPVALRAATLRGAPLPPRLAVALGLDLFIALDACRTSAPAVLVSALRCQ